MTRSSRASRSGSSTPRTETAALAFARRHAAAIAVALSAALAVAYLVWAPQTLDLSAQEYRADLWDRHGFVIWSPEWYRGHTIPGYSLIYPPLGAWLGPELVGALSAVAATALFAAIALRAAGERAWLGVIWFGLASAAAPFAGRITFSLGLAIGLACILSVQRRWTAPAAVLGAMTSLASPVAGLFCAVGCGAVLCARWAPSEWPGRISTPPGPALAGAVGSLAALAALALAFPTDGFQPFSFDAWIWIPLAALALLALAGSDQPVLRWGALLYLGLGLAAVLIETPLGSNAVRLGATFAGPLLAIVLVGRRPVLLALLALPFLWWQWTATLRDVAAAEGDPSTEAAYYEPMIAELERRGGGEPIRIEVPPTRNRWESRWVAPRVPLARGWLRQLEAEDLELFDSPDLDGEALLDWLREAGVSYVALSDADPDYLAEREVDLLEAGAVPGLEQVWSNEHWRLFEVEEGTLVEGDGSVLEVGPDRVVVELREPVVSFAFRPDGWLAVGDGCGGRCSAGPDPDRGDTWIEVRAPGASPSDPVTVTLDAEPG